MDALTAADMATMTSRVNSCPRPAWGDSPNDPGAGDNVMVLALVRTGTHSDLFDE